MFCSQNNSLIFWQKPQRSRIVDLLTTILDGGEPGFINGTGAWQLAAEGDSTVMTYQGDVEVGGKIIRVMPDIPDTHRPGEDRPKKRLSF